MIAIFYLCAANVVFAANASPGKTNGRHRRASLLREENGTFFAEIHGEISV